jgi:predicted transcriptional regulator
MKKRKQSSRLSTGELRLMGLLWKHGPLTLAEAYELQTGQLAYTTIQTQLNRLVKKRVASRSKSRPMKYRALVDSQAAGVTVLPLLIDTIGGGSIVPLVRQLVAQVSLNSDDVRQLKKIIDEANPQRKKLKKSRAS